MQPKSVYINFSYAWCINFFCTILIIRISSLSANESSIQDSNICSLSQICEPVKLNNKMAITTTLVVGATGETGKHVVAQLLEKGQHVRAIVRNKTSLEEKLRAIEGFSLEEFKDSLSVQEGSILDFTVEEISNQVKGCDAVVSCLGHTMNFSGIFGHPRRLVRDSVAKLTTAMDSNQKFILMGSEGVANPLGGDDERSTGDRFLLSIIRSIVQPHADNEEAADYLAKIGKDKFDWVIIRPTNLINGPVTDYRLYETPVGKLFGPYEATRSNVAKCMVDMILLSEKWNEYKFKMPVLHDNKEN